MLVWAIRDDASTATISDQFKANAGDYHARYAASDHFEKMFRKGLAETELAIADAAADLRSGQGSGVNSVVPCIGLFPGARERRDGSVRRIAGDAGRLRGRGRG